MHRAPEKSEALTAATGRASSDATQAIKQGFNVPNSTALTIGGTAVRQVGDLYSLNDLHKASGGEVRHLPGKFMRLDQTKELVNELQKGAETHSFKCPDLDISNSADLRNSNAGIPAFEVRKGSGGGTYACKELVIAYAAWISAALHLKVIRVFLAVTAPKAAEPVSAISLTDCGDKAKVSKFLVAMRKRAVEQLVHLDKQIAEWEVLDKPAPAKRLKIEVTSVARSPRGDWVMKVICGMCGFNISVPSKAMPRGGAKVGDKLDAYYAADGDPWDGPWIRVERRDAKPSGAIKYEFGSNYAALEMAA